MTDRRIFVRFDVGYLANPKVAPLVDTHPRAVILHLASVCYSRQHLTDGVVPVAYLVRAHGCRKVDVTALYDAGLWHDLGNGSAMVHDYLEHQQSAEDVKRASEAGRNAVRTRWSNTDRSTERIAERNTEERRGEERTGEDSNYKSVADAPTRPDVAALCSTLAEAITANGSKKPVITKAWTDAARLTLDTDKRPLDEALDLARWSQADDFWRSNILSMPKFRAKYDTLRLQHQRPTRNGHPEQTSPWDRAVDLTGKGTRP